MAIIYSYIFPSLYLFGSLVNIFNSIIFSSDVPEFKTKIFQLLKINSIIDSIVLSILTISYLGIKSYWYKLYQFYLILYVSRILNLYSSILNIQVIIYRYFFLKSNLFSLNRVYLKKKVMINKKFIVNQIAFILLISGFYSPYLFLFQVIETVNNSTDNSQKPNETTFGIQMSKIGKNHNYLVTVLSVAQTIIHILNLVLMLVFSVLLVSELRNKSENVGSEEIDCKNSVNILLKIKEKQKNTTKMVIYTSVVFCFEEISALICTIMDTYTRVFPNSTSVSKLIFIFAFIHVLSKTVNIFIYKNLNPKFRLKINFFNRKQIPSNKLKKQGFNHKTDYVQAHTTELKESS
jgi:hypothetical protein